MTEQRRYPKGQAPEDLDDNITLDANDDRWEWRRRIRSNPASHRAYRTVVAVLGLVVVVIGLIAVPAPGPGWLIVFIGVSIWASEFEWAQRLLYWGKDRLRDWQHWLQSKRWWVSALVALGTAAIVGCVFWGYFAWAGSPSWLPDVVEGWLDRLPGVG
jgi:uncharacterized protein (TIGR02611 family)